MKKQLVLLIPVLIAVLFLLVPHASALSNPPSGHFTYFYKPPKDGTTAASLVSLNQYLILTHGDESYRDSLRQAGYAGPVLQYLAAAEVQGPGPYADSSAACDSTFVPWRSQVAMDVGDFCKYLHPYESYFLHNSSGQRLYEDNGGGNITYHMNPAAAGWRSFFIQRALREKQTVGYNGLFLDNVWISLWTLVNRMVLNSNGSYPREYSSDGAYQIQMAGFLGQLRSSVGSWPILANMTGDRLDAGSWDPYLPYLNGGMNEAFAAGWPSGGYLDAAGWLSGLQKAETVIGQGKTFLAVTQGLQTDTNRMRFGYGSYLLVMQPGLAFYRYALATIGYSYQWDYAEYWTDIGTPAGARFQQSDGSWRRNFTRGYVVVNPYDQVVQIIQQSNVPAPTPIRRGTPSYLPFVRR